MDKDSDGLKTPIPRQSVSTKWPLHEELESLSCFTSFNSSPWQNLPPLNYTTIKTISKNTSFTTSTIQWWISILRYLMYHSPIHTSCPSIVLSRQTHHDTKSSQPMQKSIKYNTWYILSCSKYPTKFLTRTPPCAFFKSKVLAPGKVLSCKTQ